MVRTQGNDDDERRVLADIERFGCHIIGVLEDDEGPSFSYSIGLYQTFGQPEVIIFGLEPNVGITIINDISSKMKEGKKVEDWHEYDDFLEGYSVCFRQFDERFYRNYLGYALWYYQGTEFPVLQCVWPDSQHRYPWHPDYPSALHARQPVLSPETSWPFHEGHNRAAITTRQVIIEGHPILLVSHDHDGDWQFLCGTTDDAKDGQVVCLKTILTQPPALAVVADLPGGWRACREDLDVPWHRERIDNQENER